MASSLQSAGLSSDASAKLHVVMMPYPVPGQIIPMLEFAKMLTAWHDLDIMVTFVSNKHNHDRIRQTPVARTSTYVHTCTCSPPAPIPEAPTHACAQPDQSNLRFTWVDDCMPPDFDHDKALSTGTAQFHMATLNMKEPFKQLLQSLRDQISLAPVSCVLFGLFCPWVHTVATELGIPSVMFWTQSAAVFSIFYHMPLLAAKGFFPYDWKGLPGCKEDHIDRADLVTYIPGLPPLAPSSFPPVLHVDKFNYGHSLLAAFEDQFSTVGSCNGVIFNSFEELEKDAFLALQQDLPCPISLVGPLLPSAFLDVKGASNGEMNGESSLQEMSNCITWLNGKQKQSVLFISFGSLFNPSADELEAIALGIMLIKQSFLWVIRPDPSSPVDVSDILPKGFIEGTKEYGLIVPWAPQVQVLSHPSVGAFLTHCGWNSTLESLSMGVPMITFPITMDQPTNSTYVCDIWKVGMALKQQDDGHKVRSEDVERVVRKVLQEAEGLQMRKRAGMLRDVARQAVQAQGSSYAHIEKFIRDLRNPAKRMLGCV